MAEIINNIDSFVWGPLTIILLVGVGIFVTIRLKGIQIRKLVYGIKILSGKYDNPEDEGEVTHFQALSAALSATIGTGNIAGVGTAIATGGPGALFWMWVTAVVGMATKYCECLLSVKFRNVHEDGSVSGGPMYYLEKGLGQKWLGMLFAFFAMIASFGIGNMVQANSVAAPALKYFHVPKPVTGIIMGILVFAVIVGGIKRIGKFASKIVPIMSIFYIVGSLVVIALNISSVPHAFYVIIHDAFNGSAMAGGFAGSLVSQAIRFGVARGVFSNEAGLGSAPIAHGAAKTKYPVREGLVAMLGPFIDTIIICTMTGLVIVISGAFTLVDTSGNALTGANLTAQAFNMGLPVVGEYIVAIGIIFFALSTIISWSYYGDRSVEYLLGSKFIMPYRVIFCILIPVGAITQLNIVWNISDIFNALMALPNLIGIILLSGVVVKMTKEYFSTSGR